MAYVEGYPILTIPARMHRVRARWDGDGDVTDHVVIQLDGRVWRMIINPFGKDARCGEEAWFEVDPVRFETLYQRYTDASDELERDLVLQQLKVEDALHSAVLEGAL